MEIKKRLANQLKEYAKEKGYTIKDSHDPYPIITGKGIGSLMSKPYGIEAAQLILKEWRKKDNDPGLEYTDWDMFDNFFVSNSSTNRQLIQTANDCGISALKAFIEAKENCDSKTLTAFLHSIYKIKNDFYEPLTKFASKKGLPKKSLRLHAFLVNDASEFINKFSLTSENFIQEMNSMEKKLSGVIKEIPETFFEYKGGGFCGGVIQNIDELLYRNPNNMIKIYKSNLNVGEIAERFKTYDKEQREISIEENELNQHGICLFAYFSKIKDKKEVSNKLKEKEALLKELTTRKERVEKRKNNLESLLKFDNLEPNLDKSKFDHPYFF